MNTKYQMKDKMEIFDRADAKHAKKCLRPEVTEKQTAFQVMRDIKNALRCNCDQEFDEVY